MPTLHLHRLCILGTLARAATINSWIHTNLNPEGGDWLVRRLSATGAEPATHLGCSAGVTTQEARQMMRAICNVLSIPLPDPDNNWTRAQWKAWLLTVLAELRSKGVSIQWTDNEGTWGSFDAELAEVSLLRIPPAMP